MSCSNYVLLCFIYALFFILLSTPPFLKADQVKQQLYCSNNDKKITVNSSPDTRMYKKKKKKKKKKKPNWDYIFTSLIFSGSFLIVDKNR